MLTILTCRWRQYVPPKRQYNLTVEVYRRFEDMYYLHLRVRRMSQARDQQEVNEVHIVTSVWKLCNNADISFENN
jgi:hypothetical protein